MNRHAKTIGEVRCQGAGILPPGTPIKSVKIQDGWYTFQAKTADGWTERTTDDDLPALTDKGRDNRQRRLVEGRPMIGSAPAEVTISVRITREQHNRLGAEAYRQGITIPTLVRSLLPQ
jgi:hypothetical protein